MKKIIISLLTAVCLANFLLLPANATETSITPENTPVQIVETVPFLSISMATNEKFIVSNGIKSEFNAPILVLNKTYVDLYAIAPFLDFNIQWIEAYIGFFRVNTDKTTVDFTLISQWDELTSLKHKFFVKDSKIFVSLRELTELFGYNITYTDGIITIGNTDSSQSEAFGDVDTYNYNDYIYTAYPCKAEYVINPYQEYSYETMLTDTDKLRHMYPEFIKTSSIGNSVEGRELLLIEFGRGDKKVFVCGTHHAREYISTTYLMYAIDRYAYAYRNNTPWGKYNPKEILDDVTFYIVPMVNPDGVNLVQNGLYATKHADEISKMKIYEGEQYGYSAWKANMHGVDLNWNYDKDWSDEKTRNPRGSVGFNGDHPYSEPETIAVTDYISNNYFDAYVSFHTQGEIFYWADDPVKPSYINREIKKDTGFVEYTDSGEGIGGSFFDYAYRTFKKPTMTVELCPYIGNFPYPDNDFDTVWKPAKNVLLIVGKAISQIS